MMRKLLFAMTIVLTIFIYASGVYAERSITVKLDGKTVNMDVQPFIKNSRTMVPIRFIAEATGAEVQWVPNAKAVIIHKDKNTITLVIGSKKAVVNGTEKTFDSEAVLNQGRTFVPLRFIAETLHCMVSWVQESKTVEIRTDVYEKEGYIIPNKTSVLIYVGGGGLEAEINVEHEGIKQEQIDLQGILTSKLGEDISGKIMDYVRTKTERDYYLKPWLLYTNDGKYRIIIGSGAGNPSVSVGVIKQ